jgi:hypothetical protein
LKSVLDLSVEEILERIEKRIEQHGKLALEAAEAEASLKAWEASSARAMMDAGQSAASAQASVRALPEWSERYIEAQRAQIAAETCKQRIQQGVRWWESWRSRYSAERRVTS